MAADMTEKGRILVVDDNRLNRMKLSHNLEQQGHEVGTAENGREALELVSSQPFDVVLLDIMMPVMDGYAVLEHMQNDSTLKTIPVIVISALDEMESVIRCIQMGAVDYLLKPFNPVLLKARLNTSLGKKKLRDLEQAYLQQELTLRQNEKLATLGKLSAGMAHELNNPVAATLRGASQLKTAVAELQQAQLRLNKLGLSDTQTDYLIELDQRIQESATQLNDLDTLSLSDQEYELEAWLEKQGFNDGWKYASTLVNLGWNSRNIAEVADRFSLEQLSAVIAWCSCSFTIYSVLQELVEGAGRIAGLVNALKTYTYLDQAPVQLVNVHEGLDNTLMMLRGKLRAGVTVQRDYADKLPVIQAYGSELNQVWTNILDNAVAAMGGKGKINIRTRASDDNSGIIVTIQDDGPGIPQDIQGKIFDPFFTTKAPGQGTGLGLNITHNIITQKHGGKITVTSQPGNTCFQIWLPINGGVAE